MKSPVVSRIGDLMNLQQRSVAFPPVTESAVAAAEHTGFSIPPLLRSIYLNVGNGGFGPGSGGRIIGLEGGYLTAQTSGR